MILPGIAHAHSPTWVPASPSDDRCEVYKAYLEISSRQGGFVGAAIEQSTLFEPPKVSTEGLDRQKNRWSTSSDPAAKKIHVEGPSSGADGLSASPLPSPTPTPQPRHRLSAEEIRERTPPGAEVQRLAGPR